MTEMRMAELAQRAGLSVPTIKYYLREGLLQPGRLTSANQAIYDSSHLERLRLIRALAKVAGLPLNKVRDVVKAVSVPTPVLQAMAVTQDALIGDITAGGQDGAAAESVNRVAQACRWQYQAGSPAHLAAISAVAELRAEGLEMLLDHLEDYARAADVVGRIDVAAVSQAGNLETMIRGVVLGSVLRRPLLDALTLLAQQHYANELNSAIQGR